MKIKARVNSLGKVMQKNLVVLFAALGLIFFSAAAWGWWSNIYTSPERVFMAMLENNLRTTGVSRQVEETSASQSFDQTFRLVTGAEGVVHDQTVLEQKGEGSVRVVTETIGTAEADYIRYTGVDADLQRDDGSDIDFSDILNIWGEKEPELYNQAALNILPFSGNLSGVVPFANLSQSNRSQLMDIIRGHEVYEVQYGGVERVRENGRQAYRYQVSVNPEAYMTMLKQFGETANIPQLAQIDPANYRDTSPIELFATVDLLSRRLIKAQDEQGELRFGSYGIRRIPAVPRETIPVQELQLLIQSIQ